MPLKSGSVKYTPGLELERSFPFLTIWFISNRPFICFICILSTKASFLATLTVANPFFIIIYKRRGTCQVKIKYKDSVFIGIAKKITDDSLNEKISQLKYPGEERANEKRIAIEITLD